MHDCILQHTYEPTLYILAFYMTVQYNSPVS